MKRTLKIAALLVAVTALISFSFVIIGCGGRTVTDPESMIVYNHHVDGEDEYYTVAKRADNIGGELVIPNEYKGIEVRGIDEGGFQNCVYLTSVVVPDGITDIGRNAFYNCTGLMKVTLGADVQKIGGEAFRFCRKIVEVYDYSSLNIRAGETLNGFVAQYAKYVYNDNAESKITKDGDFSFYEDEGKCYLMAYEGESGEVVLPDDYNGSNYELYPYAFFGGYMTSMVISNGVEAIGEYSFSESALKEVTVPGSIERVGDNAFNSCNALTKVVLQSGVKEIGIAAFLECSKLISVEYSDLEVIGASAFYGCRQLAEFEVKSTVNIIGARAFYECTELKTVTVLGATAINEYAFYGCSELTTVNAPNAVVGNYAFASCSRLVSANVAGDIANGAFRNCEKLTTFTASGSIGAAAFQGCTALESITLSGRTTSIGSAAFRYCTRLTVVEVPASVRSISIYAFADCSALTSVTFANTSNWFFTTSSAEFESRTGGTASDLTNPEDNAGRFRAVPPFENGYWYVGE